MYDFECLQIFCLVDKCLKMEKAKHFCSLSSLSETGQIICHFLANQIAGKPVGISCHITMCWYELIVQLCGALPGSKTTTGQTMGLSNMGLGSFCPKDLSFLLPKEFCKSIKNGVCLMKRKKGLFSFGKWMFTSENGVV